MSDWSFTMAVPGGVAAAIALGLALSAVLAVSLWDLRREPRTRRRRILGALRIGTALTAWVIAVQPRWVAPRFEETEGRLAVLIDASRSMSLPRGPAPGNRGASGPSSRASRARALLARWSEQAEGPIATFTFGERLAGAELGALAEDLSPVQDRSRLGAALDELMAQEHGRDLGAVVVVSDGGGAEPLDPENAVRQGLRVHTVALSEEGLRDDAVAEVQADPVGFLRRSARVRVVVRSLGGPGGPIPVTLRRGDEVEREVVADVPAGGQVEVEIPFTPTRLGREVYRVSIPRAHDDAVPENNERAFLVRVTRDKLRVLLVAGQPSWDERFLRAFLKRDPATDLISFFILRNTHDLTMASPDELALIPFPTDELFNEHLGSFDLVIFQNFEYGPYQMASYLPRIRDYVMRGGSFAMVGGPLSFHSGGYAGTPIAEILPVELPPPGTPTGHTLVEDRFAPRLAEGMERHPLLELVPDPVANLAAWTRLAPLNGANVVRRVLPGSSTLLEHPEHRAASGQPLPILVVGTVGRGRTLALTTDTTWRWGITTGGATGDPSAYERFWDRAVRWLARDPSLEPAQVETDRERYGPGATARLEAHLRDPRYQPYGDSPVSFAIEGDAGEAGPRTQARTDRDGRVQASLDLPRLPGAYRVVARLPGREEPLAEQWLIVEAGGDELADPRANPERLADLSARTQGRFFDDPDDVPPLDELDTTRTRSLGIAERAPFASGWAFVWLVALFVGEWVLRRRWGRR